MTKECKQQFTLRITQANPTQLVVILYEMSLEYLSEAREALASQDILSFREAVRKTRGCLSELMESLDLAYEPAPAILQLLLYCVRRLAQGEIRRDGEAFNDIEKVLGPLKEAFAAIQDQNPKGAVMDNSQTVYAGLTYGRSSLTENTGDPGSNRGMLA